jgi:ribosomal protein S12 methylthiotransferase accessory factor
MSSNGLASGNHPLEALLHALCEVVERDAYTLWSYRGDAFQAETRVVLDSIDDPLCREVLELYEAADLTVAVWEITSDIGIPAYRCMIVDRDPQPTRLVYSAYGTGCHPAPEIALMRSLTEAAQSRATLISGSRDDVPRGDYELSRNPDAIERVRTQLSDEPECRSYAARSGVESDTFEEDVAWCLAKLEVAGIEHAYAVDLTKEELGIPVMRVILPGLEGNHTLPGFRPGVRARAALETASQQSK